MVKKQKVDSYLIDSEKLVQILGSEVEYLKDITIYDLELLKNNLVKIKYIKEVEGNE